jgi:hypothetical protein
MNRAATAVLVALVATGCAPLKGLKPETFDVTHRSVASVRTRVEFNINGQFVESIQAGVAFSKASVSRGDFARALDDSIRTSRLFAQVTTGPADYELVVSVINVSVGSRGGFYWTILTAPDVWVLKGTITVDWKLTKAGANNAIYQELVTTSSQASNGEAMRGSRRTALVVERAARENIREGIRRLSELEP